MDDYSKFVIGVTDESTGQSWPFARLRQKNVPIQTAYQLNEQCWAVYFKLTTPTKLNRAQYKLTLGSRNAVNGKVTAFPGDMRLGLQWYSQNSHQKPSHDDILSEPYTKAYTKIVQVSSQ